jgi:CRP/FNR family transcriptional regulator, cyclic AMP receptor protein
LNSVSEVLVEDPELAQNLDGQRLAAALRECVARSVHLPAGGWAPAEDAETMHNGIGLLVLDGLLMRRVGVGGRYGAELIGAGDLLRPWQLEDVSRTLPRTDRWRVLRACRLAVLDEEFAHRAGRYPEVTSCLFSRALRRSAHFAVQMAIVHQPRIDVRLHMLFWELADRWGIVRSDGVHVAIALTHAMLADLVAARRPTVTKALGELAERGTVSWRGSDWVISGSPPVELRAVGAGSLDQ